MDFVNQDILIMPDVKWLDDYMGASCRPLQLSPHDPRRGPHYCVRIDAQIELKHARNHDDGLRPTSALEHRELDGVSAINKQTAATTALIADDPLAAAILANQQKSVREVARTQRFLLVHGACLSDREPET